MWKRIPPPDKSSLAQTSRCAHEPRRDEPLMNDCSIRYCCRNTLIWDGLFCSHNQPTYHLLGAFQLGSPDDQMNRRMVWFTKSLGL